MLARHSLALNFGRNIRIRRAVNDIEDLVRERSEGGFAQPQIFPVPDELDPEIPRVVFNSRAGFSQLIVTQMGVTFNVGYSADWAEDSEKCVQYLLSRVDLLFKIGAVGWKHSPAPLFCGVTTTAHLETESQSDAVSLIAPAFSDAKALRESANELSYRQSLNVNSQFYSNIAVSTMVRLADDAIASTQDGVPRFTSDTIQGYAVEVVGDYNDRLAYNLDLNYRSSSDVVLAMIHAGREQVMGSIQRLQGKGEAS